ncbi:MAG: hypothetical protein SO292_01215 [Bacilli bacterium]|nr:hypothetical protein [Bacilli bacterium]MDD7548899.1 hypothetical protein [Bacilli bacterium]MDY4155562.1 hypothetical protein [Bacilli bacterium]MDY4723839.1 hypothetical protein [Bacilli bacterium]MDY5248126.1 hypothetical protein [Bacilli bacterium]
MGFFGIIIILMVFQLIIQLVLSQFIANYYLIELIVDIITAFFFAWFLTPDKKRFYRYETFHRTFTMCLSLYLVFAMLFAFMGL